MTTTSWNNPVSSYWTNIADWSAGVPTASDDVIINANGTYTVTLSLPHTANSLTIDNTGATFLEDSNGSLTTSGALTLDAGTAILDGTNSFGGSTRLVGGTLEIGNGAALGSAGLTIYGGTLVGTASETISNSITASGAFTFGAASGDTVTLAGQTVLDMNGGGTIAFGRTGNNGVLVWDPASLGVAHGGVGFGVYVNAGILRDGNGSLTELLGAAQTVKVAEGAKIDIYGNAETINNLNGSGTIISSVDAGELTIVGGKFSGVVRGTFTLATDGATFLSGTFAPTGGTAIDDNASLILSTGGAIKNGLTIGDGATLSWEGGTVQGRIVDNGHLNILHSGSTALNNRISGTGSLFFENGTLSIDRANTYSGGTIVENAVLTVGNSSALGSGSLNLENSTLTATESESISNPLILAAQTTATFLASHGTMLTLNTGAGWNIAADTVTFGSSTSDGVIVWHTPADSFHTFGGVEIAGGTLRAGDSNFQTLFRSDSDPSTKIDAGATLDVAGFATRIFNISGNGTIENSGATTTVTLANGNFLGEIVGPVTLDVSGGVTLSGDAANYAAINLLAKAQLHLESASSSNIVLSADGSERMTFDDAFDFTGTITGFDATDRLFIPAFDSTNPSVQYNGDTTGGTLTLSSFKGSVHIAMKGDYTNGSFVIGGTHRVPFIVFVPTPAASVTPRPADTFNLNALSVTHAASEAFAPHLHSGHSGNEIAPAHDVTEVLHTYGFGPDHFAHQLYVHEHALTAEALL
ncbi:MAG TPA: hypothetical protein VIJ62_11255 [Rhizomicrobium sp.]